MVRVRVKRWNLKQAGERLAENANPNINHTKGGLIHHGSSSIGGEV